MQYCFELVRSTSTDSDKYQSAFHCAVESVESILYDKPFTVVASMPLISISPCDSSDDFIMSSDVNDLVKAAFVDYDGVVYPEFAIVRPEFNE